MFFDANGDGHVDVYMAAIGAERVFLANGGSCLIGPPAERWDVVQLVRFPPPQAFLAWRQTRK